MHVHTCYVRTNYRTVLFKSVAQISWNELKRWNAYAALFCDIHERYKLLAFFAAQLVG